MVRKTVLKGASSHQELPLPGPKGILIYLIFAEVPDGYAGYIGHTANVQSRMLSHRRRRASGKASAGVFELAERHGVPVKIALLERIEHQEQKEFNYLRREALWFYRFFEAGWMLPKFEEWGRFKRPLDLDFSRLNVDAFLSPAVVLDEWLTSFGWTEEWRGFETQPDEDQWRLLSSYAGSHRLCLQRPLSQ